MKPLLRKIILLFICFMPLLVAAQETKTDNKENSPAATKAQRKKAKQKWKEARIVERDNKKAVKDYHKRLQTKKTLKAMKKEKKKGDRMRANKKESFFQRLFKKE